MGYHVSLNSQATGGPGCPFDGNDPGRFSFATPSHKFCTTNHRVYTRVTVKFCTATTNTAVVPRKPGTTSILHLNEQNTTQEYPLFSEVSMVFLQKLVQTFTERIDLSFLYENTPHDDRRALDFTKKMHGIATYNLAACCMYVGPTSNIHSIRTGVTLSDQRLL